MTAGMIAQGEGTRYSVRLSVPRNGGWRAWGAVSGEFERRLAEQESPAVIAPRIESEIRRGRDYVRVNISMTASAADVARALTAAWWAFRKAASDDTAGWDMTGAAAEIRPDEPLTWRARVNVVNRVDWAGPRDWATIFTRRARSRGDKRRGGFEPFTGT
jgi:hypothetical protein